MWDPVAYALGFIDCDNMSARCMLTIFSLFATKTEASLLRMLKGSPDVYLSGPIKQYITDRGGRCVSAITTRTDSRIYYVIGLSGIYNIVFKQNPSKVGLQGDTL